MCIVYCVVASVISTATAVIGVDHDSTIVAGSEGAVGIQFSVEGVISCAKPADRPVPVRIVVHTCPRMVSRENSVIVGIVDPIVKQHVGIVNLTIHIH